MGQLVSSQVKSPALTPMEVKAKVIAAIGTNEDIEPNISELYLKNCGLSFIPIANTNQRVIRADFTPTKNIFSSVSDKQFEDVRRKFSVILDRDTGNIIAISCSVPDANEATQLPDESNILTEAKLYEHHTFLTGQTTISPKQSFIQVLKRLTEIRVTHMSHLDPRQARQITAVFVMATPTEELPSALRTAIFNLAGLANTAKLPADAKELSQAKDKVEMEEKQFKKRSEPVWIVALDGWTYIQDSGLNTPPPSNPNLISILNEQIIQVREGTQSPWVIYDKYILDIRK
jgi:hypothetical protein